MLRSAVALTSLAAVTMAPTVQHRLTTHARTVSEPPAIETFEWSSEEDQPAVASASWSDFIPVESPLSPTAIGVHWPNDVGTWPHIEMRLSQDGISYSDTITLTKDHDEGRETVEGRHFTGLLGAEGARFLQYRVVDESGNPQSIPGVTITFIDTSDGPSAGDLPAISAATSDPAIAPVIVSRQAWGADESFRFRNGQELWLPTYAPVRHAIVHHTELYNGTDPVSAMRAVYYYHAITRGWGDIGYNYLIDRFGNIYEGRVGGQNVVGGHTTLFNSGSSGVCLIGDFRTAQVTTQARTSLVTILTWLLRGQNPLGAQDFWYLPNVPTIVGHQDVVPTSCPGTFLYGLIPQIRTAVATAMQNSPGGPPAGLIPGDTVVVSTSDGFLLNLRSAAGTQADLIAEVPAGTIGLVIAGPTLADQFPWFRISTSLGNGWCTAEFLELAPPNITGGGLFELGYTLAVTASSLGLLAMPTNSASELARMVRDELAVVVNGPKYAENMIWYQVNDLLGLSAGKTGWANQERFRLISDVPAGLPTPLELGDTVQTTTALNLRTSPSTTSSILLTMPTGTVSTIISGPVTGSGLEWFELQTPTARGFAAAMYLVASRLAPPPTQVPTQTAVPPATLTPTATPEDADVTPSAPTSEPESPTPAPSETPTSTPTVQPTEPPTAVPTQTMTPAPQSSPTTSVPDTLSPGDVVEVTTSLRLRSTPSTSGGVVAVMPTGMVGTVLGGPVNASGFVWWQIVVPSGTGWAAGLYLRRLTGSNPTPPAARFSPGASVATITPTNLRGGPSTNAGIIVLLGTHAGGTVVSGPEFGSGYTWWRVSFSQGTGWVVDKNISASSIPTPTPVPAPYQPGTQLRATANLRLRTAPSTFSDTIKTMSNGSIVTVIAGPTVASGFTWWQISHQSDIGWAAGEFLTTA
ncbi:hypothetical protein BH23CHL5_BH23CHL5_04240 [soil metagenome]